MTAQMWVDLANGVGAAVATAVATVLVALIMRRKGKDGDDSPTS